MRASRNASTTSRLTATVGDRDAASDGPGAHLGWRRLRRSERLRWSQLPEGLLTAVLVGRSGPCRGQWDPVLPELVEGLAVRK